VADLGELVLQLRAESSELDRKIERTEQRATRSAEKTGQQYQQKISRGTRSAARSFEQVSEQARRTGSQIQRSARDSTRSLQGVQQQSRGVGRALQQSAESGRGALSQLRQSATRTGSRVQSATSQMRSSLQGTASVVNRNIDLWGSFRRQVNRISPALGGLTQNIEGVRKEGNKANKVVKGLGTALKSIPVVGGVVVGGAAAAAGLFNPQQLATLQEIRTEIQGMGGDFSRLRTIANRLSGGLANMFQETQLLGAFQRLQELGETNVQRMERLVRVSGKFAAATDEKLIPAVEALRRNRP